MKEKIFCECFNWARSYSSLNYQTNHHPNCPQYNESLIEVFLVNVNGAKCYVDKIEEAVDLIKEAPSGFFIVREQMHKEVFLNLPEFGGF